MTPSFEQLQILAQREIDRVLPRLPRHIRDATQQLAIQLEDYPDPESGLDDDLLGVFLGNSLANLDGCYPSPEPTEIILFLGNIWDYVEGDEEAFIEEVRITFLHELGHFLGLDEIDLDERGLG